MGVIKPTYNNFSSGEITPRLYGRSDSPVFATGVERMENFVPDQFGSARRRGGFEFIGDATGVERIIPWSIDNELDILILLGDKSMKFYAVWRNQSITKVNGYLTFNGAQINLTITSSNPLVPMYESKHIQQVKYCQGARAIYMAHQEYPLFHIKFVSYTDSTGYELITGPVEFLGNVASTPETPDDEVIVTTTPLPIDNIFQKLSVLPVNTSYPTINSIINGFTITSVKREVYGDPAALDIFLETATFGANWSGNGRYLAGTNFTISTNSDPVDRFQLKAANGAIVAEIPWTALGNYSTTDIMNAIRDKRLGPSCEVYVLRPGGRSNYKGSIILRESTEANRTILTKSDLSTMEITIDTVGLMGYLTIPNGPGGMEIKIAGGSSSASTIKSGGGSIVIDNIAAWMNPDIAYPCLNERYNRLFEGFMPQYAMKKLTGLNRSPELHVWSGGVTKRITPNETIVTGQLYVNLNPMARDGSSPGFVCFHQNRLVFGGSKNEPNVFYMSKINNYNNLQFFDEIQFEQNTIKPKPWTNPNVPEWDIKEATIQQIAQDSAICVRILTDENEAIMWGASVKDLVLGTNTSEWVVPADITALSTTVQLTSRNGSSDLQGRFIGKGIIFVSRTGNDIKSFNAQFGEMGDSISAQAEHIFKDAGGIKGFDFRQDPHTEIFAALKDGTIGAATMHPSGLGYYRITTRQGDLIDSVAVINENDEDGVYILARRIINGGVYGQYLERLRTTDDSTFLGRAYLDNFSTGNTGTEAIAGLIRFYRAGFNCQIGAVIAFGNGKYGEPVILSNGTCVQYKDSDDDTIKAILQNQPYIIGYRYRSHLKLNRTDSMEMEGVPKQGGSMYLRLYKSGDVFLVRDYDLEQLVRVYTPNNAGGHRIYPYTGGIRVENIAPAGPDQNIEIMTDTHESATIQVVSSMYTVGEGI